MMKNIVIIGTRGAGKTVFTTVLAKHLSTPQNGVLMIPDSCEVDEYIRDNYAALQRGEWLPSTNTEQKLTWKLRILSEEHSVNMLDYNGEDFHRLFAKKGFTNTTSEKDKELLGCLLSPLAVVLLLINLRDFLDDSLDSDSVRRKTQREHALKEFLTEIKQNKKRNVCVIFTAYNSYKEIIKERYGDRINFLKKELPTLYYEHFEKGQMLGFPVSAVADTVEGEDGILIPERNFASRGLDEVIQWIADPAKFEKLYLERQRKKQIQQQEQKNNDRTNTTAEQPRDDWEYQW